MLMLGFSLDVWRQRTAIGSHALTPDAYDFRCRWRETRGGRLNIGDPPQRIFERNIGSERSVAGDFDAASDCRIGGIHKANLHVMAM
jgi:hypothetical protein